MSHERDRTPARPLVLGLGALGLLIVLGWVIPTWLQGALVERRERLGPEPNPLAAEYGRRLPPAPRLQVNPDRDIEALRAAEERMLRSYGWVDRDAGVVHIPIERAMALVADAPGSAPAPKRGPAPAEESPT